MKKITNTFVISLIIFLTSCSGNTEFTELGIEAEKTVEYMQIAPMGGISLTEYTFPAEIVTYHNDTLYVKASGESPMVDIIIKIAGQGADGILPVGTIVDVVAKYKQLGAPHLGWKYDVSYRHKAPITTKSLIYNR